MRKLIGVVAVCLLWAPAAHAAFPGQNGKIAFERGGTIYTIDTDGSALTPLRTGSDPAWSPDGKKIAFSDGATISVMNADGSDVQSIAAAPPPGPSSVNGYDEPAWSPEGALIAFRAYTCTTDGCQSNLRVADADGSGSTLLAPACSAAAPDWSPDGARIAFYNSYSALCGGGIVDVYSIRPDGTDLRRLTFTGGPNDQNAEPSWSPDGQKILYRRDTVNLTVINPDGSGAMELPGDDVVRDRAHWSPDGKKIVFSRADGGVTHLWVMDADGSNGFSLLATTDMVRSPDWQPIPINSYPRPKGATPTRVALVPAYAQCTAPDRTHGPPLAFPSCASPVQTSDELTVGTADSNGKPTKSSGLVRYDVYPGAPATPADEADVQIKVALSDVYEQGSLTDYTGELRARTLLRITDKLNTPHPGGPGAATVSDATLGATVPCTATTDTTEGASCNLVTTFDALVPGTVTETKRSIWALGAAQLDDGGADNDADTPGDNTLFMTQGIFIP